MKSSLERVAELAAVPVSGEVSREPGVSPRSNVLAIPAPFGLREIGGRVVALPWAWLGEL